MGAHSGSRKYSLFGLIARSNGVHSDDTVLEVKPQGYEQHPDKEPQIEILSKQKHQRSLIWASAGLVGIVAATTFSAVGIIGVIQTDKSPELSSALTARPLPDRADRGTPDHEPTAGPTGRQAPGAPAVPEPTSTARRAAPAPTHTTPMPTPEPRPRGLPHPVPSPTPTPNENQIRSGYDPCPDDPKSDSRNGNNDHNMYTPRPTASSPMPEPTD